MVLGKYQFVKLNDIKPKFQHTPESIARQVNNQPNSISLRITNILTPTNEKGETDILLFRSVLEAARDISIKEQISYQSARYQLSKAIKNGRPQVS